MDIRRLTLHQLRVFRAVARHRNFTRAAEELLLTQSAVSAQIRELTDLLGVPILEQLGKKTHLTAAGRSLEEQAARVEGVLDEIAQDFTEYREAGAGSVRIGASTSIGTYYLPPLISDFSARYPRVEVSLEIENTAHIQERLLRNDFDLAYVGGAVISTDLVTEPFLEEEIFFACAPSYPLARSRSITPEKVSQFKLIIREPGSATRRTMEEYCLARGIAFTQTVQLGSVEAIKQAVMAGLGFSYFSALTVRPELETGRLVRLQIKGVSVTRTFLTVRHRQKKATPAMQAFMTFAKEWIY